MKKKKSLEFLWFFFSRLLRVMTTNPKSSAKGSDGVASSKKGSKSKSSSLAVVGSDDAPTRGGLPARVEVSGSTKSTARPTVIKIVASKSSKHRTAKHPTASQAGEATRRG